MEWASPCGADRHAAVACRSPESRPHGNLCPKAHLQQARLSEANLELANLVAADSEPGRSESYGPGSDQPAGSHPSRSQPQWRRLDGGLTRQRRLCSRRICAGPISAARSDCPDAARPGLPGRGHQNSPRACNNQRHANHSDNGGHRDVVKPFPEDSAVWVCMCGVGRDPASIRLSPTSPATSLLVLTGLHPLTVRMPIRLATRSAHGPVRLKSRSTSNTWDYSPYQSRSSP